MLVGICYIIDLSNSVYLEMGLDILQAIKWNLELSIRKSQHFQQRVEQGEIFIFSHFGHFGKLDVWEKILETCCEMNE